MQRIKNLQAGLGANLEEWSEPEKLLKEWREGKLGKEMALSASGPRFWTRASDGYRKS